MNRTTRVSAAVAAALLGAVALAGCSSDSSDSSAEATAAASEAAGTSMLPPVIITADQSSATCKVGDNLDIVVDEANLAGTTVGTEQTDLVELTQAREDGDALFNPGGTCLAPGDATITVTNPDGSTRDIALTIAE